MKVLLINGSPRKNGCTNRALLEMKKTFEEEGIDADIVQASNDKKEFETIAQAACEADGIVLGSPVYYAAATPLISEFAINLFAKYRNQLRLKPAASVVSCRRGGAASTFDQINKFFFISEMIVVGSNYWNQVHGYTAEDVEKDEEGLQTMRCLARNMGYVIRALASSGASKPEAEKRISTNFIR